MRPMRGDTRVGLKGREPGELCSWLSGHKQGLMTSGPGPLRAPVGASRRHDAKRLDGKTQTQPSRRLRQWRTRFSIDLRRHVRVQSSRGEVARSADADTPPSRYTCAHHPTAPCGRASVSGSVHPALTFVRRCSSGMQTPGRSLADLGKPAACMQRLFALICTSCMLCLLADLPRSRRTPQHRHCRHASAR